MNTGYSLAQYAIYLNRAPGPIYYNVIPPREDAARAICRRHRSSDAALIILGASLALYNQGGDHHSRDKESKKANEIMLESRS